MSRSETYLDFGHRNLEPRYDADRLGNTFYPCEEPITKQSREQREAVRKTVALIMDARKLGAELGEVWDD